MRYTTSVAIALTLTAAPAFASDVEGRWITASGNLEVEIAPCAAQPDMLCGTVVRVIANHSMSREGEAMQSVDSRPALGMSILTSLVANGGGAPWTGDLYNRENGKTYHCVLSMTEDDQLEVYAHLDIPVIGRMFGRTQLWQRARAPDSSQTPSARPGHPWPGA